MENLWKVRLFLCAYGNVSLSESYNLTSRKLDTLNTLLAEWKKDENEAENSRTTSINKTLVNVFKNFAKAFGGK